MRIRVALAAALVGTVAATATVSAQPSDQSDPVEVEVRGRPATPDVAPRDPSVAGSTVRRIELARPGLSAADMLRTEVGVSVTETGGLGAPATASIRGATAAQTPVYLGGVRINDDVAGFADLSTLPLWLVERVEIYRGNAPLEADRLGIGGAIFFEPIRPHGTSGALGANFGSFGTGGAWTYATAGNDDRGVLIGLSLEGAANDYSFTADQGTTSPSDDRRERLQNADVSQLDAWLIGRSAVGSGETVLTVNHFEREQGAQRPVVAPTFASRLRTARNLGSIAGRAPLGRTASLELRTTALLVETTLDDQRRLDLLIPAGFGGTRLTQLGERVEQELGAEFELGKRTRARVSATGSSERFRRIEAAELLGMGPTLDAQRVSGRIAANAEYQALDWLSLRALAALEGYATSTSGPSASLESLEPVGRLGALATAGEFSAFAGVGRYVRAPTLGELFGTTLAVHGNPTLAAESGATIDAGLRYAQALPGERGPAYASISGYLRRASDLVTYVRTDQDYVTPVNKGVANVAGMELEGGFGFARYFGAELGVTLLDFRDDTPNNPLVNDILPYHSRLVLAPALEASTPHLGHTLSVIGARATLVYQSNRYADFAGQEIIPEQASLDIDCSLGWFERKLVLRARAADVLDAERYDIVGFPLPKRSFFFSLEARSGAL